MDNNTNQGMYNQGQPQVNPYNQGNPQVQKDMYGQQGAYMGNGQPMYNQAIPPKNPSLTTWLIISILQIFCCNNITGIISLIFTILADSDFKKGLIAEYDSKMKAAKIATIVGVISGVIIAICLIIYYIIIFGIAFSEL